MNSLGVALRSSTATRCPLASLTLLAWLTACSPERAERQASPTDSPAATSDPSPAQVAEVLPRDVTIPEPSIPFEGDVFKPSLARMAQGEQFDAAVMKESATCAECHADVSGEWRESMHAFASLSNDIYLSSFKDFIADRGEQNTRFCAGCHDPALMFDAQVGISDETSQASAHLGISCNSCHGMSEATAQGNASYVLSTRPVPLPVDGDDKSLADHIARVAPPTLRSNALCVSCHRGVLTPQMGHDVVLPGLDELGPWRRSAFNQNQTWRIDHGDIPAENCVSCHMPKNEQGHSSHRFAGGHSTFAAMLGSEAQLQAVRDQVEGAATLDIFPLEQLPAAGARNPGRVIGFDVVVFNERVGHAFPGGAKDLRDTWIEVTVRDAHDRLIASSGLEHAETGKEDYVFVMHARLASEEGMTQRAHNVSHFRTPVYDHTIKPRDATVARYLVELPESLADKGKESLKISARLRHRRLTPDIYARACEFKKSEAGALYLKHTQEHKGVAPDPCVPQPILDVAHATLTREGDRVALGTSDTPLWERHYRYGLGLLHHVQEHLDEARVAFQHAQEALPADSTERERAMVIQGLAMVSARQGRTDEAVELFMKADALVPDHPSTFFNIGLANMRVWRFEAAAEAFERADGLQKDARILRQWAIALGSTSQHAQALEVAQRGLQSEPRDPDMLRSQMLAYRGLEGASEQVRALTAETYDVYKADVQAPHVRDKCSQDDLVCRAERTPIGVRWLHRVE